MSDVTESELSERRQAEAEARVEASIEMHPPCHRCGHDSWRHVAEPVRCIDCLDGRLHAYEPPPDTPERAQEDIDG